MQNYKKYILLSISLFLTFTFIFLYYSLTNKGISFNAFDQKIIKKVNENYDLNIFDINGLILRLSKERGLYFEIAEITLKPKPFSENIIVIDSSIDFKLSKIIISKLDSNISSSLLLPNKSKYDFELEFLQKQNKYEFIINKISGSNLFTLEKTKLSLNEKKINIDDSIKMKINLKNLSKDISSFIDFNLPEAVSSFESWTNIVLKNEININDLMDQKNLYIKFAGIFNLMNFMPNLSGTIDVVALDADILLLENSSIVNFNFLTDGILDLRGSQANFDRGFNNAKFDIRLNNSDKLNSFIDRLAIDEKNQSFFTFKNILEKNPIFINSLNFRFDANNFRSLSSLDNLHNIQISLKGRINNNFISQSTINPSKFVGNTIMDITLDSEDMLFEKFSASGVVEMNDVDIFYKPFNLKKEKGTSLSIDFNAIMGEELLIDFKNSINQDLLINGNIKITKDKMITISNIDIANSKNLDLRVSGDLFKRVLNANIEGDLIDLSAFKTERKKREKFFFEEENYKITAKKAYLEDSVEIDNFKLEINQKKEKLKIKGSAESQGNSLYYLREKDEKKDTSSIKSNNIISFIGQNHPFRKILSRGDVNISSSRESYSSKSYNEVRLNEFTLINTPAALKLITLPSLSGISSIIEDESGINFIKGEVKYEEDIDYFSNIEMYGVSDSIGLVMEGSINRKDKTLKFEGEISPIHLINMLLKKVPIIGDLIVGEEGEGLFAFEFLMDGPSNDPNVSSNPLSIAKPQILERAAKYLSSTN